MKLDHDRGYMYDNIVLCGGSVRFGGFQSRVERVESISTQTMKISTTTADEYSSWMDTILASLQHSTNVDNKAQSENGTEFVHRKCFRLIYWFIKLLYQ